MSTGFDRLAEKRELVLKAMLAAGYARQQLQDCLGEQAFPEEVYSKLRDDSDKMWSYDLKFDGRTLDQWTRAKPGKAAPPQRRGLYALGGALLGLTGAGIGKLAYDKFKTPEEITPEAPTTPPENPEGVKPVAAELEKEAFNAIITTLKDVTSTLKQYNAYNSQFESDEVKQLKAQLEASEEEVQKLKDADLNRVKREASAESREAIEQLRTENIKLTLAISELNGKNGSLQSELESLRGQLASVNLSLVQRSQDVGQTSLSAASLQQQLQAEQLKTRLCEGREAAANQRAKDAEDRAKAANARADACETARGKQQSENLNLGLKNVALQGLETQIRANQTLIASLRTSCDKYRSQMLKMYPICQLLHTYGMKSQPIQSATAEQPPGIIRRAWSWMTPSSYFPSRNNTPGANEDANDNPCSPETIQILKALLASEAHFKDENMQYKSQVQRILNDTPQTLMTIDISTIDASGLPSSQILQPIQYNNDIANFVNATLTDLQRKLANVQYSRSRYMDAETLKIRQLGQEKSRLEALNVQLQEQTRSQAQENVDLQTELSRLRINEARFEHQQEFKSKELSSLQLELAAKEKEKQSARADFATANKELKQRLKDIETKQNLEVLIRPDNSKPADDIRYLKGIVDGILYGHFELIQKQINIINYLLYAYGNAKDLENWGEPMTWMNTQLGLITQDAQQSDVNGQIITNMLSRENDIIGHFNKIVDQTHEIIINSSSFYLEKFTECSAQLNDARLEIDRLRNQAATERDAQRLTNLAKLKPSPENEQKYLELKRSYDLVQEQSNRDLENYRQRLEHQYTAQIQELTQQLEKCIPPTPFALVDQYIGQFFTTENGLPNGYRPNRHSDLALLDRINNNHGHINWLEIMNYFDETVTVQDYDMTLSRIVEVYQRYEEKGGIALTEEAPSKPEIERDLVGVPLSPARKRYALRKGPY